MEASKDEDHIVAHISGCMRPSTTLQFIGAQTNFEASSAPYIAQTVPQNIFRESEQEEAPMPQLIS